MTNYDSVDYGSAGGDAMADEVSKRERMHLKLGMEGMPGAGSSFWAGAGGLGGLIRGGRRTLPYEVPSGSGGYDLIPMEKLPPELVPDSYLMPMPMPKLPPEAMPLEPMPISGTIGGVVGGAGRPARPMFPTAGRAMPRGRGLLQAALRARGRARGY